MINVKNELKKISKNYIRDPYKWEQDIEDLVRHIAKERDRAIDKFSLYVYLIESNGVGRKHSEEWCKEWVLKQLEKGE